MVASAGRGKRKPAVQRLSGRTWSVASGPAARWATGRPKSPGRGRSKFVSRRGRRQIDLDIDSSCVYVDCGTRESRMGGGWLVGWLVGWLEGEALATPSLPGGQWEKKVLYQNRLPGYARASARRQPGRSKRMRVGAGEGEDERGNWRDFLQCGSSSNACKLLQRVGRAVGGWGGRGGGSAWGRRQSPGWRN